MDTTDTPPSSGTPGSSPSTADCRDTPDTDDLYDEKADEADTAWMQAAHPGTTDAILSCPCCFTQVCFVCQQHTRYDGQFRALSVHHCKVMDDQLYSFTKNGLAPVTKQTPNEVFKLVVCAECDTKLGVVDDEQVYHLFHVLCDS
ncbi:hypothetical protein GGI07_001722 [Coemansia sp. Benny D115]|nr:hypothetical protein GGI07_001722 [Coemansia sp. Benny D115]